MIIGDLDIVVGDCSGQSTLEALAVLVGIRIWGYLMKGRRLRLGTRTDNAAALSLQGKLASSTTALNFLGAELAIELEMLGIEELRSAHLPGVLNETADALSRLSAPGSAGKTFPTELVGAKRRQVPVRNDEWYRLPTPGKRKDLWGSSRAGAKAGHETWLASRSSDLVLVND